MKFKLDENLGTRTQNLFQSAGFDIETVRNENLQGCSDLHLYQICCAEQRCLITLDVDFADIIRFPPDRTQGIAVIRVPKNPSLGLLEQLVRQFLTALREMDIKGQLWIVEVGRIRVQQSETI
ncbi:MAG: DUF5615 family PIN-like protein [Anaerolineae bacterium]|nr:DUF5615 family PIN-like protein [Anaerolineae bacterium]